MDPIAKKVKQWIDEKKDPRSAHWQGGLEAVLKVFSPYCIKSFFTVFGTRQTNSCSGSRKR